MPRLGYGWVENFFQSLENCRKIFPIIGKIGQNFPTIGNFFSNHWKTIPSDVATAPRRRGACPEFPSRETPIDPIPFATASGCGKSSRFMPGPGWILRLVRWSAPWNECAKRTLPSDKSEWPSALREPSLERNPFRSGSGGNRKNRSPFPSLGAAGCRAHQRERRDW